MKKIFRFFKNLFKCSFKELLSILLDLLSYACSVPSLFINFFIVFYLSNTEMTSRQKGSALLIIGIIILFWLWINGIIKRDMLDHKKPFSHIIVRMIYKIKYLLLLCLVLYLYTVKVDYYMIAIYLLSCMLTYCLSVIFRAFWLKLNNKEWDYEYAKKSIKFR